MRFAPQFLFAASLGFAASRESQQRRETDGKD
jgi:hypothetical protein